MAEDGFELDQLLGVLSEDRLKRLLPEFDVRRSNAARMAALRDTWRERGLVLVLGAGVSTDAGAPSWNALLSALLLESISAEVPVTPAQAAPLARVYEKALQGSAPVLARYAKDILGDRFVSEVRRALYARTHRSVLLDELAQLAIERTGPGVREVITYNYDDLFEEALLEAGGSACAVERNSHPTRDGLAVLHVHGTLPRVPNGGEWMILSEDDYHREYADPYSWSNIVQLSAFSQRHCLFVGLSMEDPNLRRLLEAARRGHGTPHFVFLRRTEVRGVEARLNGRWREETAPSEEAMELARLHVALTCMLADAARDAALAALGVSAIWFDRFSELPRLLRTVRTGV